MMTTPRLISIANLLAKGRAEQYLVCLNSGNSVDWATFSSMVSRYTQHVAEHTAIKRWFICSEDSLDFAAALLGTLHAGRRAVIPPNFLPGTVSQLSTEYDGILGNITDGKVAGSNANTSGTVSFARLSPDSTFIDMYTSGSSGKPKLVEKSIGQLDAEIKTLEAQWGHLIEGTCTLGTVPHHHIYGLLFRLLWPLAAGRPFETCPCSEPDLLVKHVITSGAVNLISSPAHLARLPGIVDLSILKPHLRSVFSSGAPLPRETALLLNEHLGKPVAEVYGSTETGGIGWRCQNATDIGAAWTPFEGIEVTANFRGTLCLRSPFLSHSDRIELADAGESVDGVHFILKGRTDRIVKVEGKRLSLPEAEERLRLHSWVSDAALVTLGGQKQSIGAVVILSPQGRENLTAQSRKSIAAVLGKHMRTWYEPVLIPRRWRFPEQMPVDERGKPSLAILQLALGQPA